MLLLGSLTQPVSRQRLHRSQPALLLQDPGVERPQPILHLQLLQGPLGEERQLFQIRFKSSKARKRASSVPVPVPKRAKGAAVPDTPQRPEPLPPAPEPKKNLPWKAPPIVVPPRPNRPVPPNPANLKPVKPPPPGVERAKPASAPSRDLPPLDPEGQQQHPEQEQSSGSGLAPHVRGRPLPEPTPDRPEGVAGTVPRHYQQQPKLVSKVVHVNTSNVVVCIDWHDTIDQALNPIGELSTCTCLVEKLRVLTRVAGNRIEFHIVSYAGESKVEIRLVLNT